MADKWRETIDEYINGKMPSAQYLANLNDTYTQVTAYVQALFDADKISFETMKIYAGRIAAAYSKRANELAKKK